MTLLGTEFLFSKCYNYELTTAHCSLHHILWRTANAGRLSKKKTHQ